MKRLSAVILVLLVLLGAGWYWQQQRTQAAAQKAAAAQPLPQPLGPKPAYVKTAEEFFSAWQANQPDKVYGLLSSRLKSSVTREDFTGLLQDVQLTNLGTVGQVGGEQLAYVALQVSAKQKEQDAQPIAGYSVLLRKEAAGWRVALFLAEEKLPDKYMGLKISPQKDGATITYHDTSGRESKITLSEP